MVWDSLRKNIDETTSGSIELDIIKLRTGLKDLNNSIWQSKLNYARELANTTLFSQQNVALKLITTTTTTTTTGESIESKIIKLQQAGEQAKALVKYELEIARARILEAKRLVLLNGETQANLDLMEAEANLHLIALNLTANEQIIMVEQALNNSIIEVINSDNGIRFCLSNGTNCANNQSTSNLTNYALKNQSETFAGNITTTQTGFFGWLGSLTNRITTLFVQDINASGNVTASYFIGDGSYLTGIPTANISFNQTLTDSLYAGINDANNQSTSNLTNYALKNQSETFAGNITTTQTGFFGWLGSLTNRITKLFVRDIDVSNNIKTLTLDISTNATLESLIFRRHDAFGMAILLNNTNEAIRIFASPNITNPSNGAGLQLFGNNVGLFPGDVYLDAGSRSGGQIIIRTGVSGLNDRVIVEDDGRVKVLNLTGSGNDYLCVDANGYLFRSNTAC